MKILVVGSGGREHAICASFAEGANVDAVFCADGNAGIAEVADCVPIKPVETERLAAFALEKSIDLTFVGGETALALGIVDEFERLGLKIVGASKAAARLEASKSFAKDFMARWRIPTARYEVVKSVSEAREILQAGLFGSAETPVVIKADGLAAGKGVIVAPDRQSAIDALDELVTTVGQAASETIVLEECLFGREVSLLAFCDGSSYRLMPPVRDHKRIGDGDRGPNTGGMGTVADRSLISPEDLSVIERDIVIPTLEGCRKEGFPFKGILFIGLMMTSDGAKVLEYNVRFGDPETQVILPLLRTDLATICDAMTRGGLSKVDIDWSDGCAACIVLAARGYPGEPQRGDIIYGLDLAARHSGTKVFHAGTASDDTGHFVTSGGRVLGVTSTGAGLSEALDRAYLAVNDISWNGMQFRHDIGR
ncbi:MAG: phosphoribosylamine--glycine ligase [Acidobacteria bacterium]|nr:phosphoribosylamine--glycine ligase [Acidobacteriota bacterium]